MFGSAVSKEILCTAMESVVSLQEDLGSKELLTNRTTQISNKLLTLASPKPREKWFCGHMTVTVPSIGTVWYIPMSWLLHTYLEMTCIREMDLIKPSYLTSVVQVLIALSVAVLVLFTIASVLRLGHCSKEPTSGGSCVRRSEKKQYLHTIKSHKYVLQAVAAFFLVNSYMLLEISQLVQDSTGQESGNDTEALEQNVFEANRSEASLTPLPWQEEKMLTYLLFCGNFMLPLIIFAIQESELVWQKEKLWGFFYSFIMLLLPFKYLSYSLTFYVIRIAAYNYPQALLFQGVSKWLPALYITSVLCLVLFSLALKIYMNLSFKSLALRSAGTVTIRCKFRSYPSPLWVILMTLLILGCDIPYILHFIHFILLGAREVITVFLLAFSIAFCLLCITVSVFIACRRKCHNNSSRINHNRIDSGVCLANSFVYQDRAEASKAKC